MMLLSLEIGVVTLRRLPGGFMRRPWGSREDPVGTEPLPTGALLW
jgi:hypothetical protein